MSKNQDKEASSLTLYGARREVIHHWLQTQIDQRNEIGEDKRDRKDKERFVDNDQDNKISSFPNDFKEGSDNKGRSVVKESIIGKSSKYFLCEVTDPKYLEQQLLSQGIKKHHFYSLFVIPTNNSRHACAVIVDHQERKIFDECRS